MRTALMIAILIGGLAGCDLAPGAGSSASPRVAPSASASPTASTAAVTPMPSGTPSLPQLGEAYLVVASKYQHTIDVIEDQHQRTTVKDYNAYCRETETAIVEYVDGLRQIEFGPDQQPAVDTLVDSLTAHDALLGPCIRGKSLTALRKLERSLQRARSASEDAAIQVRQVLGLPVPAG